MASSPRWRRARTCAGATVIATTLPDLPRALPAAELAAAWRRLAPISPMIVAVDDPIAATDRAIGTGRSRGRGLVVVAGSLYLVGAVRAHLVDDPSLRDPAPGDAR